MSLRIVLEATLLVRNDKLLHTIKLGLCVNVLLGCTNTPLFFSLFHLLFVGLHLCHFRIIVFGRARLTLGLLAVLVTILHTDVCYVLMNRVFRGIGCPQIRLVIFGVDGSRVVSRTVSSEFHAGCGC